MVMSADEAWLQEQKRPAPEFDAPNPRKMCGVEHCKAPARGGDSVCGTHAAKGIGPQVWADIPFERQQELENLYRNLHPDMKPDKDPDVCSVEGCDAPVKAHGWCSAHYFRWRNHGDLQVDVPVRKWGGDPICSIEGCERKSDTKGLCRSHYTRLLQHGDPFPEIPFSRGKATAKLIREAKAEMNMETVKMPNNAIMEKPVEQPAVEVPAVEVRSKKRPGKPSGLRGGEKVVKVELDGDCVVVSLERVVKVPAEKLAELL